MTPPITATERRVLLLRANGMTLKAVAAEMGMHKQTVSAIGRRIRDKLDVETELEAMRLVFGWRLP